MRHTSKLFALLLAMGPVLIPAAGCAGEAQGYITYDDPPPAQREVVVERPGQIFVHGNYVNDSGHWRWQAGHYERARTDQVYVQGRWTRHGDQRVWVNGGWKARA